MSAPLIDLAITNRGTAVYSGRVFPLRGDEKEPLYVYERRVADDDGRLVSTHVTRDRRGAIQIAESATHGADYGLVEYTLHTNQRGETGSIRVREGALEFVLRDGDRERARVERSKGDVVVGPTLVGYLVQRLDVLTGGACVELRLAVIERRETIGFRVESVPAAAGLTRLEMRPSSMFIALVVDAIYFTFETTTKKLVRLEGRVPLKVRRGARWKELDARVEYDFVAATYR